MTDIRFYHLQKKTIDQALPQILSKALAAGHRIVARFPDDQEVQRMNERLWTFRPNSFLPHGSKKDGWAEDQPIWLTDQEENPNNADVLVLSGVVSSDINSFKMCCEMLDGNNEEIIESARARWKSYKDAGHDVTYWQQTEKGGWEQKS